MEWSIQRPHSLPWCLCYIVGRNTWGLRLKIVTIMDLGSTLDFWLKGVWSTLLTWRVLALVFVGMSGAKNCAVTDSGLVSNIDQIA